MFAVLRVVAILEGDDLLLIEKARHLHLSACFVFSSLLSNIIRLFCASRLSNTFSRFSYLSDILTLSVDFSLLKIPHFIYIYTFRT